MEGCAVIFDLDGTLTKPYLDFDRIRAQVGVTGPILEAIAAMGEPKRRRAEAILLRHEREAAENATPQEGAVEVVHGCRRRGYAVAILTRNARETVNLVLEKFGIRIDALRTREDGALKPSALPVLSICKELGTNPRRSWVIGDYLFDLQCGRSAGTRTVLMIGDKPAPEYAGEADFVIRKLTELLPILGLRPTNE